MTTRVSHSVADTEAIAAELARTLKGGECIALFGELGAGKTQFVRVIGYFSILLCNCQKRTVRWAVSSDSFR